MRNIGTVSTRILAALRELGGTATQDQILERSGVGKVAWRKAMSEIKDVLIAKRKDGSWAFMPNVMDAVDKHLAEALPVIKQMDEEAAAARAAKKEKPRLPCHCGCGNMANPGKAFVTGHDSTLRGLIVKVRDGKMTMDELQARTPQGVEYAKSRGWFQKYGTPKPNKKKKGAAKEV